MATKVMALETGFYDGIRRRKGDTFILPAGQKPGKWMKVVGEAPAPKAEKPKAKAPVKAPETFSEISKSLPTPKDADLV